jgi:hypothetical protein
LSDPVGQPKRAEDCAAVVFTKLLEYIALASSGDDRSIEMVREPDTAHLPVRLSSKRPYEQHNIAHQAYANKRPRRCQSRDTVENSDDEYDGDADGEEGEDSEEGWNEDSDDDKREDDEREDDGHEDDESAVDEPEVVECEVNERQVNEREVKDDSGKAKPTDEDLAMKITSKIKNGFKRMKKKKELADACQSWPQASDQTEEDLWARAEEASQRGKEITWMLRYLASCFALVRMKFASDAGETDETHESRIKKGNSASTRDRWRWLAHMVNCIVDGLYESWANNAYLVCFALAGKSPDPNCGDCLIRSQQ